MRGIQVLGRAHGRYALGDLGMRNLQPMLWIFHCKIGDHCGLPWFAKTSLRVFFGWALLFRPFSNLWSVMTTNTPRILLLVLECLGIPCDSNRETSHEVLLQFTTWIARCCQRNRAAHSSLRARCHLMRCVGRQTPHHIWNGLTPWPAGLLAEHCGTIPYVILKIQNSRIMCTYPLLFFYYCTIQISKILVKTMLAHIRLADCCNHLSNSDAKTQFSLPESHSIDMAI